jgi:hypothetical protein
MRVKPDIAQRVLVHRSFSGRERFVGKFNLAAVMDMIGDLTEIAHIEPLLADRALHEMVGFGSSDAISIATSIARDIDHEP